MARIIHGYRPAMRRLVALVLAGAFGLSFAACDGDGGGGGSVAAYCALIAEFDDLTDLPSDEQLNDLRNAAPDEIGDEVDLVADALSGADSDAEVQEAAADPEVSAAGEELTAFEEENCEDSSDGGTDDTTEDTTEDTTDGTEP